MNADNISAESMPDTAPKKKSRLKKAFKVIAYSVPILFFLLLASYIFYVNSGSSTWELEIDRDGVQVYSMKAPGIDRLQFKGVTHFEDTTLSELIALIVFDDRVGNCKKWIPTCIGYEPIEEWDPVAMRDINLWQFDGGMFFSRRDLVLLIDVDQDPETLEVFVNVMAAPSVVPYDECCVRITELNNTWRYTPTADGGVDVVFRHNLSMGGWFPDFLANFEGAEGTYNLLKNKIPELREDFKELDYEYENIRELGELKSEPEAPDSASLPEA